MSIEKYLDNMKNIYENLLSFLDNENNIEENFQNLCHIFQDIQIKSDPNDLKLFMHLIVKICNNHHHCPNFYDKIDRILAYFKEDIKKHYSNTEIISFFISNKRLLLFLIEEKVIIIDECFVQKITNEIYLEENYLKYFKPEIMPFSDEKWFPKYDDNKGWGLEYDVWTNKIKKDLPANFYEKRKKGENDSYICKLIQDDSIEDFIEYVDQEKISLQSTIEPSIYETNSFLIQKQIESKTSCGSSFDDNSKKGVTLIEYAAFFGSIQIFKYLKTNGVEMSQSLWLYSVHGKNMEIIHLLEENKIEPTITDKKDLKAIKEKIYNECFFESIKCNHNDIANYFLCNYLHNGDMNLVNTFIEKFKYYNFGLIQKEDINDSFRYLCQYDYYPFVENLLADQVFDINQIIIQHQVIQ